MHDYIEHGGVRFVYEFEYLLNSESLYQSVNYVIILREKKNSKDIMNFLMNKRTVTVELVSRCTRKENR